jgi:hypothetical protein
MSKATNHKRQLTGEWLGFHAREVEDIEHETYKSAKYVAQPLVNTRKGRVHLLIEEQFYECFLAAVHKKFGNISAANVEKAAIEAIEAWIKEEEVR